MTISAVASGGTKPITSREAEVIAAITNGNADIVRRLLDYDPLTGLLRWRARTLDMFTDGAHSAERNCAKWNNHYAGAVAGSPSGNGYLTIVIFGRRHQAHRLAWLIMTGKWPVADIDHENLDRADNRWSNLRHASHSQNMANTRMYSTNTSGLKGVSWHKQNRKWVAQIGIGGKSRYLGSFETLEAAHAAYCAAAAKHFGEFARAA